MILGCSLTAGAATPQNRDLSTLKWQFAEECARLENATKAQRQKLGAAYADAAERLRRKVQGLGDLDKLKAVIKEQRRFERDGTVPRSALDSSFEELRGIQISYLEGLSKIEAGRAQKMAPLVLSYDKALERLEKELTKKGALEEATEVRSERQHLKNAYQEVAAKPPASLRLPRPAPMSSVYLPKPVLWLTCEGLVESQVKDISGHNNHAMLHRLQEDDFVPVGENNHALRLSDRGFLKVKSSRSLLLAKKGYTLSIWCKPDATEGSVQGLIAKWKGGYDKEYGFMITRLGTVQANVEKSSREETVATRSKLKPGKWYHLALTFDPRRIDKRKQQATRIYVNGRSVATDGDFTILPDDTDTDVQIGHFYPAGYSRYFNGLVDDARIYAEPLDPPQIEAIWKSPPSYEMVGDHFGLTGKK